MAEAFPASSFTGFDSHPGGIERAREAAEEAGVAERVRFEIAGADALPVEGYDLVCLFDAFHDLGDPAGAARHLRETLAPDGTLMLVEPQAGDRPEDNLNPVGRMFYAGSALICVPHAIADSDGQNAGARRASRRGRAGRRSSSRRASARFAVPPRRPSTSCWRRGRSGRARRAAAGSANRADPPSLPHRAVRPPVYRRRGRRGRARPRRGRAARGPRTGCRPASGSAAIASSRASIASLHRPAVASARPSGRAAEPARPVARTSETIRSANGSSSGTTAAARSPSPSAAHASASCARPITRFASRGMRSKPSAAASSSSARAASSSPSSARQCARGRPGRTAPPASRPGHAGSRGRTPPTPRRRDAACTGSR